MNKHIEMQLGGAEQDDGDPPDDLTVGARAASTGGPAVLSKFALPATYADGLAGVKRHTSVVSVTKPKRTWWWIANPDYVLQAGLLTDETSTGKDVYLVAPDLASELGDDVAPTSLHGCITRQGVFFVNYARLPGADGRLDNWTAAMREAIVLAQRQPVRTASNRDLGAYDVFTAPQAITMPPWPQESWDALLAIAFRDRMIEDLEHPVLRRLRGEV
jgi:hypothetical protein